VLALLGPRIDALSLLRRGAAAQAAADSGWWSRLARTVMRRQRRSRWCHPGAARGRHLGARRPVHRLLDEGTARRPGRGAARQHPLVRLPIRERGTAAAHRHGGPCRGREIDSYAAAWLASPEWSVCRDRSRSARPLGGGSDARRRVGGVDGLPGCGQRRRAHPRPVPGQGHRYTASFIDFQASVVAHLPWAALLLAATTLVILFVMTASVVLPVKALIMNMLTMTARSASRPRLPEGLAERTARFRPRSHQPDDAATRGALAFGLSTDYGVFLLSRIREGYRSGLPTREASHWGFSASDGWSPRRRSSSASPWAAGPRSDRDPQGDRARRRSRSSSTRAWCARCSCLIDGDPRPLDWWAPPPLAALHGAGLYRWRVGRCRRQRAALRDGSRSQRAAAPGGVVPWRTVLGKAAAGDGWNPGTSAQERRIKPEALERSTVGWVPAVTATDV